ncbi:MAG: KEOPS complex subunit Cgi121 [Candidatus Hadarchaeota archaeon]|nr:KEOPS complex subunit Cgi121 [Candidatus Hadarchaeota archaeon]
MFELEGPFGKRVVGVIGGQAKVKNVDGLLQKLAKIDGENETTSQILDAPRIAGKKHLLHATRLALIAHATGKNFAQSLDIELLCWITGLRQIKQALERVGVHEGEHSVALLTIGNSLEKARRAQEEALDRLEIKRDDEVLEITPEKTSDLIKAFSIHEQELETASVDELILERVALLSLQH